MDNDDDDDDYEFESCSMQLKIPLFLSKSELWSMNLVLFSIVRFLKIKGNGRFWRKSWIIHEIKITSFSRFNSINKAILICFKLNSNKF